MHCNSSNPDDDDCKILTLTPSVFYVLLILQLALWVWALIALIQHWKKLDTVWRVFGVVFLFPIIPFGPVFTLLIAYVAGNGGDKSYNSPEFFLTSK